jgi:hypothetical protein
MKNLTLTCAAVAVVAVVLMFPAGVGSQASGGVTHSGAYQGLPEPSFTPQADDNDLSACQQDCRSRFGYDVYANPQWRGGGGGDGAYYAYANCIADCNRRFWKSFDNEMNEMEKEK